MISGAMDYTACLGIAGEAAVKVVRFFFVLIQGLTLHSMFSKHIGPLVLFSKLSSAGLSAGLPLGSAVSRIAPIPSGQIFVEDAPQWVGLCLGSLTYRGREVASLGFSEFPNRVLGEA